MTNLMLVTRFNNIDNFVIFFYVSQNAANNYKMQTFNYVERIRW